MFPAGYHGVALVTRCVCSQQVTSKNDFYVIFFLLCLKIHVVKQHDVNQTPFSVCISSFNGVFM